jgi:hypothetical protein
MGHIKKEIQGALEFLKINAKILNEEETSKIVNGIYTKYTNGKKSRRIWENTINDVRVVSENDWKWISRYIGNTEAIMFFEPTDEKIAFVFSNGDDILRVLEECFGFEFYLTNFKLDYLLTYDHHNVLGAVGDAAEHLQRFKDNGTVIHD